MAVKFQYLDKRVQRSKQDLFNALFDLLEQKTYNQITIKDIIEKAGYSRGTFYTHYKQKDDLLDELIELLFDEMIKAYRSSYIDKDSLNIKELINEPLNYLNHFMKFGKYYRILLGKNIQTDFRQKITDVMINLYLEEFEIIDTSETNNIDWNIFYRYCGYGLIGIILEWIMDDFPIEPEKLTKELIKTFQTSLGTIRIKGRFHSN